MTESFIIKNTSILRATGSLAAYRALLLLLSFIAIPSAAPATVSQRAGSDTIFRTLILDRIRAYGRGDVRTYMSLLADGFVHVSDLGRRRTKEQMPAFVRSNGNTGESYDVSYLAWRIDGNLAIVDARIAEHRPEMEGALRETDIFTWHAHRWLYLRHHETAVLQPPVAVAVPGDRLTDYAGSYKTAAGTIDIITVKGGKLFDRTLPDDAATPLVRVARGAFGFADDPTFVVFVRDTSGSVTQCLWHLPSGQTTISQRTD